MRPFFMTVGILAWMMAFAVMWIFAESGGALTAVAAGVFAILAILALACERILRLLEQIRDGMLLRPRRTVLPIKRETAVPEPAVPEVSMRPATDPATTLL